MKKYKILMKGMMMKIAKFEDELNAHYKNGWVANSMTMDSSGRLIVLLERKEVDRGY